MRRGWVAVTSTCLAVLLSGCGTAKAPPAGAPAAEVPKDSAAEPAAKPKRGGILTMPGVAAPRNLHPYPIAAFGENQILGPVYETLIVYRAEADVDYTQNYETIPWLAEGWDQSSATTYVFRLRKGIKWQDGVDFTAADVKFSYDYARDPDNKFAIRRNLGEVATVDIVDSHAVRVVLAKASARFLENLADFNMMILPKHVFDRGDELEKVAVGTGPFKIREFRAEKGATYQRNDNYWLAGKPYPNGVEVLYGLDRAAQLAAFVTGNLDITRANTRPEVDQFLQQAVQARGTPFLGQLGVQWILNLTRPPLDDVRVRRAMHLALDRQGLNRVIASGDGMIQPPVVPPHKAGWAIPQDELLKLPGYRQPKDQDLAEAKRLLAEAGYASGVKVPLLYGADNVGAALHVEAVAGQLARAGIEVDLQRSTAADYRAREASGDFVTIMPTSSSVKLDRHEPFLHSKGSLNKAGPADPGLDRLLEEMDTQLDLAARQKAALELQRYLLDKLYVIPLVLLPVYHIEQPWVKDHRFHRGNTDAFDTLARAETWLDVDQMPPDRRR